MAVAVYVGIPDGIRRVFIDRAIAVVVLSITQLDGPWIARRIVGAAVSLLLRPTIVVAILEAHPRLVEGIGRDQTSRREECKEDRGALH
jgi:hypothetical protein